MIADKYRGLQTIAGRAYAIGDAQVYFGDWHEVDNEEQHIAAVTAADLQRVAAKYLTPNNRTVATLLPDTTPADTKTSGAKGGQ